MDQDVAKRRILKLIDRKWLCVMAHGMAEDGKPARGTLPVVASLHDVSSQCAHKIFKEIRAKLKEHDNDNDTEHINNPTAAPDEPFNNKTSKRRAGKSKHCRAAVKAALKAIPLADRRRCRHLAAKINTPTTTVWRMVKQEKPLFRHTSNLKPKPTNSHQHLRMLHCPERIDTRTINSRTHPMKFVDQFNEAHVDESGSLFAMMVNPASLLQMKKNCQRELLATSLTLQRQCSSLPLPNQDVSQMAHGGMERLASDRLDV